MRSCFNSSSINFFFVCFIFFLGDCKVEWWASEGEDGPYRKQETKVTEDETNEGKQTTGKTEQTNSARQADDGAETQETHGAARFVPYFKRRPCFIIAVVFLLVLSLS